MSGLSNARDVQAAALGLGIQNQLGRGLVLPGGAGLQEGIQFGIDAVKKTLTASLLSCFSI